MIWALAFCVPGSRGTDDAAAALNPADGCATGVGTVDSFESSVSRQSDPRRNPAAAAMERAWPIACVTASLLALS